MRTEGFQLNFYIQSRCTLVLTLAVLNEFHRVLQGDYKILRGMFPHAAGKIASNGPYDSVDDIYKIPGLTENDKKLFKKYEKTFTVNPPGRAFDERINNRVST